MTAPWVRWFTSDWVADTAHLGPLEEGVYSKLIHHYYQSRKALTADIEKLCMIARATEPASRRAVEFVLAEYFIPGEDPEYGQVYRHHRADREIEWSDRVHRSSSDGGKKGMESRWGKSLDKGVSKSLNNTPYNNQNQNHNQEELKTVGRFSPPTVEEIVSYAVDLGYQGWETEAKVFIAFYASKGWMVGKNRMKDWKSAVVGWQSRRNNQPGAPAARKRRIEL